jgi:hypothetical protein
MKRAILAGLAIAALVLPATANASPWLTRTRAHREAASAARWVYDRVDEADSWSVQRSYECLRRSARTIDCDYSIYYFDGMTCDSMVRVHLGAYGFARTSFPYDPTCY